MLLFLVILSTIAYSDSASCQRRVCFLNTDICRNLVDKQAFFENAFKAGKFGELIDGLYDVSTVLTVSFLREKIPTVGRTKKEQLAIYKKISKDYIAFGYTRLTISPRKTVAEGEFYVVEGTYKLVVPTGYTGISGKYYQKFNADFTNVEHRIYVTKKIGGLPSEQGRRDDF